MPDVLQAITYKVLNVPTAEASDSICYFLQTLPIPLRSILQNSHPASCITHSLYTLNYNLQISTLFSRLRSPHYNAHTHLPIINMKVTLFTLAVAGFAAAQNLDGLAPCIVRWIAQPSCSFLAMHPLLTQLLPEIMH